MFLLPIILGLVVGFVAGFFAVQKLLELATFAVVALFAGMMLGGTPVYLKEIKSAKPNWVKILLLIVGLIVPIGISVIAVNSNLTFTADQLTKEWWMFVIAVPVGFLVAITQLVPGLSATSTLLSIGLFKPIVNTVHMTYWKENPMIFVFYLLLGIGFLVGLFVLSKILNKVIDKFKAHFYYLALGLSFSSIAAMFYNPEIVSYYDMWTSTGLNVTELVIGIVLFVIGVGGILAFFIFTERKNKKLQIEESTN
jgi:putative membrane protein